MKLFLGISVSVVVLIAVVIGLIRWDRNQTFSQPSAGSITNVTSEPLVLDKTNIPQQQLSFGLTLPANYQIGLFADGIPYARDLVFSPEGTLLVSQPDKGQVQALVINGDSVKKNVVIAGLSSPHGLAFYQNKLFIAEYTRLARYSWNPVSKEATLEKELMKLPSGGHASHTLVFDQAGNLYIKIGSSCNVCKESDSNRATIIKTDQDGKNPQVFAKGLRNAAFIAINPLTDALWASENGRDYLGDELPPDEINLIFRGGDYGWPYCYGKRVHDNQFDPSNQFKCDNTEPALFEVPAHSAPLGITFLPGSEDVLVALHGSWNRSTKVGYKIIKLKIIQGKVTGSEDFLTGFLQQGQVFGRPVDLAVDKQGNIFVSDDKSGAVYVITAKT